MTILAAKPTPKPVETRPADSAVDYQTFQAEIAKLFTNVLNIDVPSTTSDLLSTGILDSQKFVELLLQLERTFGVQIELEDFEFDNFRCIENIASLVLQCKTSTKRGAPQEEI